MPELHFVIRWPDETVETCYSPSSIIRDHFVPGTRYPMMEFLSRSRNALMAASERVRTVHGMSCSLALGQLARIEAVGLRHAADSGVVFESFKE